MNIRELKNNNIKRWDIVMFNCDVDGTLTYGIVKAIQHRMDSFNQESVTIVTVITSSGEVVRVLREDLKICEDDSSIEYKNICSYLVSSIEMWEEQSKKDSKYLDDYRGEIREANKKATFWCKAFCISAGVLASTVVVGGFILMYT